MLTLWRAARRKHTLRRDTQREHVGRGGAEARMDGVRGGEGGERERGEREERERREIGGRGIGEGVVHV